MGEKGKLLAEAEKKLSILSQEIERLNGVIEKKNIDLGNMNKNLIEMEAMSKTI